MKNGASRKALWLGKSGQTKASSRNSPSKMVPRRKKTGKGHPFRRTHWQDEMVLEISFTKT